MQTPLTGGTPQATLSFTPQRQQFEQPAVTAAAPLGIPYQPAYVPDYVPVYVQPAIGFNVTNQELTIQVINPGSLYYQSGLRQGDVVLSSNGKPILTQADFERLTASNPGQAIPLVVRRDGKEQTIEVLPRPQQSRDSRPHLGVRFDLGVGNAAMISSVTPGSPAEAAGLQAGDIVTVLNGEPVGSYQQAIQLLAAPQPGNQIDIRFTRPVESQAKVTLDGRPRTTLTTAQPPSLLPDRPAAPPASAAQALR